MTRIHALLLAVALGGLAAPSCSWFEKHPVIPAVVTCSGETIPLTLVTKVYDDAMGEDWIDLATNIVPLLKDGWADVDCIFTCLGNSNPETVPHIKALRAKHADEFKGAVSLRSPGDSTPPAGPTVQKILPAGVTAVDGPVGRADPGAATSGRILSLSSCDRSCGGRNTSIAPPDGCQCWRADRKNWRNSRWVPLREMPGRGLVAAR